MELTDTNTPAFYSSKFLENSTGTALTTKTLNTIQKDSGFRKIGKPHKIIYRTQKDVIK